MPFLFLACDASVDCFELGGGEDIKTRWREAAAHACMYTLVYVDLDTQ